MISRCEDAVIASMRIGSGNSLASNMTGRQGLVTRVIVQSYLLVTRARKNLNLFLYVFEK